MGAVVIDEIRHYNLDLPDRVAHCSGANASFKLERLGAPKGRQRYSCAEGGPFQPRQRQLKPGASYRTWVDVGLAVAEGEYRAEVDYRGMKAECRFTIVP